MIVEIKWRDTTGHSGWHTIAEAHGKGFTIMSTVGYLFERNDDFIKLVRSIEHDGDGVGDVFVIPTEWVQSIRKR